MHLGSLFTALASYLDARANHGRWLLRIDDLDKPRNRPDSVEKILYCLEIHDLLWDEEVYYQSRHIDGYKAVLAELAERKLTYPCDCSRKLLAELSEDQKPNGLYPGLCRDKQTPCQTPHAVRIKTSDIPIIFKDALQGVIHTILAQQSGDYILKRKDGIIAYQLAVVVDDARQRINQVVRGYDLLFETPKQIYLQQLLGLPTPNYAHVPVIVDEHGYKLSKQTLATAVDTRSPAGNLVALLVLLKQEPPDELATASVSEILNWAVKNWRPGNLRFCSSVQP